MDRRARSRAAAPSLLIKRSVTTVVEWWRCSSSLLPVLMKWNASDLKKTREWRKSWITLISPEFLMSESSTITSLSCPNIWRVTPRRLGCPRSVRSRDLYEIWLAGWFARIPRSVRRIQPRSQKRFTHVCEKRNAKRPLPVALGLPRAQQFQPEHEKRNVSLPLLLSLQ